MTLTSELIELIGEITSAVHIAQNQEGKMHFVHYDIDISNQAEIKLTANFYFPQIEIFIREMDDQFENRYNMMDSKYIIEFYRNEQMVMVTTDAFVFSIIQFMKSYYNSDGCVYFTQEDFDK